MNNLDINKNGGEPFVLDDIDFLQSGLGDAINGLASFFTSSGDPVIVSGLKPTVVGLNVTFSNGIVVVNNEVFLVDGGTFLLADTLGIDINQTTDSNGDKLFESGLTYSTYLVRRGTLTNVLGVGVIDLTDFRSIADVINYHGGLVNLETAWQPLVFTTGFSNQGGAYGSAQYRRNKIGNIELSGTIKNASISTIIQAIGTLGYHPLAQKAFIATANVNGSFASVRLLLSAAGVLNYIGSVADNVTYLSLDGITFQTT